jgi:hypothetical protein
MLVCIHVERTGGTTMDSIFRRAGSFVRFDSPGCYARYAELAKRPAKIYSGHIFWEWAEHWFKDAEYVTLLRHPVDRWLSHWRYSQQRPHHKLFGKYPDPLDAARAGIFRNLMTWRYAHGEVDLAMERLASCKLIGNTVHLNRFVRELDLNVGRLPHKNPTEPAIDCDRRLVAQLNDKDMEIWNRAQSLPRFIQ